MAFDPDKYLAKKQPAFDPDVYLAAKAPPSEIPQRRGVEMFGGVSREVSPAMQLLSPEQKREALKTGVTGAASVAAGPLLGAAIRYGAPFIEALPYGRAVAPVVERFGRSVESGGLAPGLSIPQRVLGGTYAGGISAGIVSPEDVTTGAAIGAATPAAAKLLRPFVAPSAASAKEVKKAVDAEYAAVRELNETVTPDQFNALKSQLDDAASQLQYLPSSHTKIAKGLQMFKEQSELGQPVTIDRLDKLRRELSRGGASANKDERDIAKALVAEIDSFIARAAPASSERLAVGRTIKTQESKTKIIDDVLEKARTAKGVEPSETIRNEFYKIAQGKTRRYASLQRQFSPEEQQIVRDIGEGRLDINALQNVGAVLAPPRILQPSLRDLPRAFAQLSGYGIGAAGFGTTLGVPVAAGLALGAGTTGAAARAAANRLAQMRAMQLRAQILAGREVPVLAPEVLPQFAPAAVSTAPVNFLADQERVNQLGF